MDFRRVSTVIIQHIPSTSIIKGLRPEGDGPFDPSAQDLVANHLLTETTREELSDLNISSCHHKEYEVSPLIRPTRSTTSAKEKGRKNSGEPWRE